MAERYKVRDGVFVKKMIRIDIDSPDDQKTFRQMLRGLTPEGILEEIKTELNEAIDDPKNSDRRKHDLKQAFFRLGLVQRNLADNATRDLLFNFYCLMNDLWRAKIRPFEGGMFHKAHLQELNKKGNQVRIDEAEEKHRYWQDIADAIRDENPRRCTWSKTRIANEVYRRLVEEDSEHISQPDWIRKNIT